MFGESAEHVLFGCNGLNLETVFSLSELVKGRRVPEEGLVQGFRRFLDLSDR